MLAMGKQAQPPLKARDETAITGHTRQATALVLGARQASNVMR